MCLSGQEVSQFDYLLVVSLIRILSKNMLMYVTASIEGVHVSLGLVHE